MSELERWSAVAPALADVARAHAELAVVASQAVQPHAIIGPEEVQSALLRQASASLAAAEEVGRAWRL